MPGSNENEDVLKCLHQCAESLQIPAVTNSVSSGTEMLIDSKGSVVKVDGKKAKDVASMVNSTLSPIYYFSFKNLLKIHRYQHSIHISISLHQGSTSCIFEYPRVSCARSTYC